MNLTKYDDKLVRITDKDNNQYEGICYYNNKDFNDCEYGRNEESLDITCIKFYKSFIKKVEIINSFSNEYGKLEELIAEDGDDLIDEVFNSEEDEHIYRLLKYIVDKNIKVGKKLLLDLLKYNKDKRIINIVNNILEKQ
jgi:hypothetical protein